MANTVQPPVSPICPYLGMRDDLSGYIAYPSPGNRCYRTRRPGLPGMVHQHAYCLSGKAQECPVFTQPEDKAFPSEFAANESSVVGRRAPFGGHSEDVKFILERMGTPARLDDHPWAKSLVVQEVAQSFPAPAGMSPGFQLTRALAGLFRQLMPATPPQQTGKRLDTRWGRFGILAASYFVPFLFGRLYPRSLREAWRRIDQAILLLAYGKPAEELEPEQVGLYQLVGDEPDMPAKSTISDWHRGGMQELAEAFLSREQHLSLSTDRPSPVLEAEGGDYDHKTGAAQRGGAATRRSRLMGRRGRNIMLVFLLLAVTLTALSAYRIYQSVQAFRQDVTDLQQMNPALMQLENVKQLGLTLKRTQADVEMLRADAAPWLWLTRRLGWVPVYGGDLKYAGDLLEMASGLTGSASQTYETAFPIWMKLQQNQGALKASELTRLLLTSQPSLQQSQMVLQQAVQARQRITLQELSPGMRSWMTRVDPYVSTFDEALSLLVSLPNLLGGSNEGPKTYLVLFQNEDELRATGGFITGVAKVVVWNGDLISWDVADSYSVDNTQKAYPPAPWQMQHFMNIPIMTFRDANWSPDFPKTALWAEYLYAYTNSYSVNGVIAIDQHVLSTLLSVTGPLYVKEIDTTVTSENVEQVMRAQKVPPAADVQDPNWYRKHFLNPIAGAVLSDVLSGHGFSWGQVLNAMIGELDRRNILIQLDDPTMSKLLAERGWDGSVARTAGDYLMVVDTNVGYNKTNAVVRSHLVYDVDLKSLSAPTSNLAVFQENGAKGLADQCDELPSGPAQIAQEFWYPVNRCYYDYLRVYLPAGAYLTSATPHPVTRSEMIMLDQDVPARVDRLDENLEGLQGFGTLLVVPMGGSLETDFHFALPVGILQADALSDSHIYQLRVHKQPGTGSIPITIRIHLPTGSRLTSISPANVVQEGEELLFELDLATDVNIRIQFQP